MEIIILFVVISIITNIIKAVGRSQKLQPAKAGEAEPSVLQEVFQAKNNIERVSPNYKVKIQTPTYKAAKIPLAKTSLTESQTKPQAQPEQQPKSQPKVGFTNLTPNKLVEGIILSEILAPPKSRR